MAARVGEEEELDTKVKFDASTKMGSLSSGANPPPPNFDEDETLSLSINEHNSSLQ